MSSPFCARTLVLVTGASRGLGREIAVRFSQKVGPGSVVVLTGRNQDDLLKTRDMIALVSPEVKVAPLACDLAVASDEDLAKIVYMGLELAGLLDAAIIVHNSGSVGDVSKSALQHEHVADVDLYFRLNVASVIALNAVFVKLVKARISNITVLNISSLCALQPFKSMSLYCTGKAARDMFFRVLAAEQPALNVLSYAPGPLVTEMSKHVATSSSDPDIKKMFNDGLKEGFLTCQQTVSKLIKVLEEKTYQSGAHVDYFDEEK